MNYSRNGLKVIFFILATCSIDTIFGNTYLYRSLRQISPVIQRAFKKRTMFSPVSAVSDVSCNSFRMQRRLFIMRSVLASHTFNKSKYYLDEMMVSYTLYRSISDKDLKTFHNTLVEEKNVLLDKLEIYRSRVSLVQSTLEYDFIGKQQNIEGLRNAILDAELNYVKVGEELLKLLCMAEKNIDYHLMELIINSIEFLNSYQKIFEEFNVIELENKSYSAH